MLALCVAMASAALYHPVGSVLPASAGPPLLAHRAEHPSSEDETTDAEVAGEVLVRELRGAQPLSATDRRVARRMWLGLLMERVPAGAPLARLRAAHTWALTQEAAREPVPRGRPRRPVAVDLVQVAAAAGAANRLSAVTALGLTDSTVGRESAVVWRVYKAGVADLPAAVEEWVLEGARRGLMMTTIVGWARTAQHALWRCGLCDLAKLPRWLLFMRTHMREGGEVAGPKVCVEMAELARRAAALPPGPCRAAVAIRLISGCRWRTVLMMRISDLQLVEGGVLVVLRHDKRTPASVPRRFLLRGTWGRWVAPFARPQLEAEAHLARRPWGALPLALRLPSEWQLVLPGVPAVALRRAVIRELLRACPAPAVAAYVGHSLLAQRASYRVTTPAEEAMCARLERHAAGEPLTPPSRASSASPVPP